MRRKEAIIRYLAHVGRANRDQMSEATGAPLQVVSARLTELRRLAIVRRVQWVDGTMVWVVTEEGARRFSYYVKRDRET